MPKTNLAFMLQNFFGFHVTKNLALIPQTNFGSLMPQTTFGSYATKKKKKKKNAKCKKTKFGFYATQEKKSGFHAKTKFLASIQSQDLAFKPSIQKLGLLPQNQAFMPKQPLNKGFSTNDNLLIKLPNKHSHFTFT